MLAQLSSPAVAAGPAGIAWVDWVALGSCGLFLLLGAVRGLWWQIIRLVGLALAISAARTLGPLLDERVTAALPNTPPRLVYGLVWIAIFVAVLGLVALLGRLGRRQIEALQLGLADRFSGALVGAVTGAVLFVALLVVVVQLAPQDWLQRTLSGTYSERVLLAVGRRWSIVMSPEAGREVESALVPVPVQAPTGTGLAAPPRQGGGG